MFGIPVYSETGTSIVFTSPAILGDLGDICAKEDEKSELLEELLKLWTLTFFVEKPATRLSPSQAVLSSAANRDSLLPTELVALFFPYKAKGHAVKYRPHNKI